MTDRTPPSATEALERWLLRGDRKPTRAESGNWDFSFCNGRPFRASARSDDEWLRVELSLDPMEAWAALRLNHELEGVRLVEATPHGSGLRLRADGPCDGTASPVEQLAHIEQAFQQSLAKIEDREGRDAAASECGGFVDATSEVVTRSEVVTESVVATKSEVVANPEATSEAFAELRVSLESAGWPTRPRGGDRFSVDLSVPGRQARGTIGPASGLTYRVSTPLLRTPVDTPLGRWAVGRFLLVAVASYSAVRPVAHPDRTVHLEVDLRANSSGRQIDLCLGPLALAARDHAQEAELLGTTEEAAAAYAALRPDAYTPTLGEE